MADDDEEPRRRWWQRLLSGPAFVITGLVAALIGLAAPFVFNAVRDAARPPLLAWASSDGGAVGDLSFALPEQLPEQRLGEIGTPYDFFAGGATKVGVQGSTVTVEGAQSRDIVITNMRAKILSRGPNVTGTLFCAGQQGDVPADNIGFDLDEVRPVARELRDDQLGAPFFAGKAKQLTDGETAVFQIEARAAAAHYRWELEIDLVVDGRPQTIGVHPPGGPFEITGTGPGSSAVYRWRGNSWSPDGPGRSCG
ncbi:hypothetical protein ABT337_02165 [Saccharopolyspora hirsuta]|uniref:hypothetical protein n=1 Tax=Saccharopolyspora hirsuta TaxID=1837 RepID=UPI00332B6397